jgi:hypothetical protein
MYLKLNEILWLIDPLLGKDLETNKTTAVAVQQAKNKRCSQSNGSANTHATTEERCFRCGPCKVVTNKRTGAIQLVESWQFG